MEKCLKCGKVMKMVMYSHNWLMRWYKCKACGSEYKRGYTKEECLRIGLKTEEGNYWFPSLVEVENVHK